MLSRVLPWVIAILLIATPLFATHSFFDTSFPLIRIPDTTQTIPFHTPVVSEGYALPTHITQNTTLDPSLGIIRINSLVTVEPNVTVTIKPGTTLAVSEYGGLDVFGSITAQGTQADPITFITNERNERNRHWVGILLEDSSTATIEYTDIHHASPAISCSAAAHVTLRNITTLLANTGFAHDTFGCEIR